MVKTLSFYWSGLGLIPGLGTKIPHAIWWGKKKKKSIKKKKLQKELNTIFFDNLLGPSLPDSKPPSSLKFTSLVPTIPHHACW